MTRTMANQGGAAATPPGFRGPGAGGTAPSRAIVGGTGATPSRPSRRHPVHLPNIERHNHPVIVFLTVCTSDRQPVLATPAMHALLLRAWKSAVKWRVGHYLIMPDHVHLFCSPTVREAENVRDWAGYWKGLVARAVQGYGPLAGESGAVGAAPSQTGPRSSGPSPMADDSLWQRDCWDTQLRDVNHYGEKWQYVAMNPVRRRLAASPESWPFTGTLNELRW